MKKLLYLATLSLVATLMFASVAVAQEEVACPAGEVNVLTDDGFICVPENVGDQTPAETDAVTNDPRPNAETPIVENQDPCPDPNFPRETPDGCQASGLPDVPTESPTPEPTTPTPSSQSANCGGFDTQFGAQQFYDFNATAEEQAILDVDGDGFACDDLETGVDNLGVTDADRGATGGQYETPETPTATETPAAPETGSDTVLPDTGGPAILLPAAGLLLATGLIGLTIVRRRS